MAVKNEKLGGTDWTSADDGFFQDFNDTFDASNNGLSTEDGIGNLTYSTNSTITNSYISCENLTVNSGVTLTLSPGRGGCIVFCSGTFTINGTVSLDSGGNNGLDPVSQTGIGNQQGDRGEDGFVTRGGSSGKTDSSQPAQNSIIKNVFEDDETNVNSPASLSFLRSHFRGNPTNAIISELSRANFVGGAGSAGGIRCGSGANGTGTTPGAGGGGILIIAKEIVVSGTISSNGDDADSSSFSASGGSVYAGGSGGGSGGPIILVSLGEINAAGGTFSSVGGDGCDARNSGFATGEVDGGSGGNGGVVCLHYRTMTGTPTYNVGGGGFGSGALTGSSGSSGSDGTVIEVSYIS